MYISNLMISTEFLQFCLYNEYFIAKILQQCNKGPSEITLKYQYFKLLNHTTMHSITYAYME